MNLLVTIESYESDFATKTVWQWFSEQLGNIDGIAYYRHPIIRSVSADPPDLTLLAKNYHPVALRILAHKIEDLDKITEDTWTIQGRTGDSPLLQAEDFIQALQPRFQQQRLIRNLLKPVAIVALPNVEEYAFANKFPGIDVSNILFQDKDLSRALLPVLPVFTDEQWHVAKSAFQSAAFVGPRSPAPQEAALTMGAAIKQLERDIMLLDNEQHKVAIQLPAGPQRIRGLAGTGKTVLLAMKAANLHLRFPDRRILFTFFTQSLYRNVTELIRRFYMADSLGNEPNWGMLHVRHAWGGGKRLGVYSETCRNLRIPAMDLTEAKRFNSRSPLGACCAQVLQLKLVPTYDHVLVDEAQDLPPEFFKLLYALTNAPKAIYWAYDELQNLSSLKMPELTEQFGVDEYGKPNVSLDGEYPGGIEKDLVLQKSYRCPGRVLMLAHAIGLGLYSPRGCIQMLPDAGTWNAVGYEVESGELKKGEKIVLTRPAENSPNRIEHIYAGSQQLIQVSAFPDRDAELDAVAASIINDVTREEVNPEQIVVVTLSPITSRQELPRIQRELFKSGIQSIIPGLVNDVADFASPGMVTLTSVYRAKGNEAPVVYVINADLIGSYLDDIDARNKSFTAISRAKGWVRISGSGATMASVSAEFKAIIDDYPRFRFSFPDLAKIRNLHAETTRRRKELKAATKTAAALLSTDAEALKQLGEEKINQLIDRLKGLKS